MLGQTGRYAAVGLEMGLAMAIGIFGGRYLDEKLQREPVFFWIGFGLGVGAAVKALVEVAVKARKTLDKNGPPASKKD